MSTGIYKEEAIKPQIQSEMPGAQLKSGRDLCLTSEGASTEAEHLNCPGNTVTVEVSEVNYTPFGINRFVLLLIVILYSICVGSHFFNWTPWETILKRSGAFSELCPTSKVCKAQEEKIASLLPLASVVMFSFTFIAGMVLDVIGPKVCCLFGNILLICGWILLKISSSSRNIYAFGFALMGAGTDPAFFGTLSIANLFPGYCSTVISILGAARSVSNVLPFLMQEINEYDSNFTFSYMALIFVILYLICFLAVVFLIPWKPYRLILSKDPPASNSVFELGVLGIAASSHPHSVPAGDDLSRSKSDERIEVGEIEKSKCREAWRELKIQFKALWRGMRSPLYYPIIIVMIINMIRNNFYLTSASKQLGSAITALTIVNMLAFIPGPILGFIVDKCGPLKVIAGLNTTNLLTFVTLLIGQVATNYTLTSAMNYTSTILAFPGIGFLLSQIYCYVSVIFPPADMGKLAGLASFMAGLCGLVVNPMYAWSSDKQSFWEMDTINIGLSLLNYFFIIFLMFKLRSTQ